MKIKRMAVCLMLLFPLFGAGIASAKTSTGAPAVDSWYFRAVSGYPAAIAFEPVVLFKNGEYFDIGEEPLELLDVAASKAKRPAAWGTWKKVDGTFTLTNNKGKAHDYKLGAGNWFPAFAYTGALKLKKGYKKVSGGDYGNGTQALFIDKITFVDDTHFVQGSNSGISTPAATASRKGSSAGTYRISSNTIEFTTNGKTIKRSFAFGATGTPATATNTMIFIGGDAFTDTE